MNAVGASSLSCALNLKEAGLLWQPQMHDFFAVPDTELADRVFVISDMTIDIEQLVNRQMITFNGAVEWSLDYVMQSEVVWMPTESQLRELLVEKLREQDQPAVRLDSYPQGCQCLIQMGQVRHHFEAATAADAFARALLFVLNREKDKS